FGYSLNISRHVRNVARSARIWLFTEYLTSRGGRPGFGYSLNISRHVRNVARSARIWLFTEYLTPCAGRGAVARIWLFTEYPKPCAERGAVARIWLVDIRLDPPERPRFIRDNLCEICSENIPAACIMLICTVMS
ncbi:MAG TPA: hypothetical protein PK916_15455, partial [Bacteroidota bacterium]|nr:hypothetical protein [Bacteroidota bacterium]